jgi:hypothetical protein
MKRDHRPSGLVGALLAPAAEPGPDFVDLVDALADGALKKPTPTVEAPKPQTVDTGADDACVAGEEDPGAALDTSGFVPPPPVPGR